MRVRGPSAVDGYGVGDNPSVSANLDLVRSIYAVWERGDFSAADWAHPEIEFAIVEGPSPGTFRGLEGMAGGHGDWMNAWEDFHVRADECRELDEERVLVLDQPRGRGKSSGLDIGQKGATLFQIRNSRVIRLVINWDRERALAGLGLEE